jgi:methylated-DNA-[protein]-cysteine S-methyltransferase
MKTAISKSFYIKSPVGWIRFDENKGRLASLQFVDSVPRSSSTKTPLERKVKKWLEYFFQGSDQNFPWEWLDVSSGTPFRQKVWKQLWQIPFGEVRSYSEIAKKIGKPKAARAIGQANHHNPLPLVIPCHRVIAANGSLGGYACGLKMKKRLLKHEKVVL